MILESEMRRKREALQPVLAKRQRAWPSDVRIWIDDNEGVLYQTYPHLLRGAFPSVADEDVERLSLACRLFFESVFLADKVVDGHVGREAGQLFLRIEAMQFEAYHVLGDLFPADAAFWNRFRETFATYVAACSRERRYRNGTEDLAALRSADAVEIARGKFPFARIAVFGLAELSGETRHADALVSSIEHFDLASYYWDDLKDWRKDLRARGPSLVIGRLLTDVPPLRRDLGPGADERFSRVLYLDGAAEGLLGRAIRHLDRGLALTEDVPVPEWRAWLESFRSALASCAAKSRAVIRRNRRKRGSARTSPARGVP